MVQDDESDRDSSWNDPNILARIGETPTVNYISPDTGYIARTPSESTESALQKLKDVSGYTDIKEGVKQLEEGNYLEGATQAGTGVASALPFSPAKGLAIAKGAAELAPLAAIGGMFYGKGAKTADTLNLAKAQFGESIGSLGRAGLSPERAERIRQKTGWFRGADDQWKFEGSDDQAKLTLADYLNQEQAFKSPYNKPSQPGDVYVPVSRPTLKDLIDHPVAYENWPGLRDIKVTQQPGQGANASYNAYNDTIAVSPALFNDPDKLKSSLLHEIQHAIQTREGFGGGASPREFLHPAYPSQVNAQSDKYNDIVEAAAKNGMDRRDAFQMIYDIQKGKKSPSDFPEYAGDLGEYKNLYDAVQGMENFAKDRYHRHAGEVEARLTQDRRLLTPEERRATPLSPDVSPMDQIVRIQPKKFDEINPVATYFGNMFR